MKNISFFLSENFQFLEMNFFVYLNRRNVYIMYHAQISMKSILKGKNLLPSSANYFFVVFFIFIFFGRDLSEGDTNIIESVISFVRVWIPRNGKTLRKHAYSNI